MSRHALIGMGHDARAAAEAVDNLTVLGRVVRRRTYPILDLLRMGTLAINHPEGLVISHLPTHKEIKETQKLSHFLFVTLFFG